MTAGDPVFVDTNVLIYASRPAAGQHAGAVSALERLRAEASALWISPQVLREYLAAPTRPQSSGAALPMSSAIADVQRFRSAFNIAAEPPDGLDRLLHLLSSHPGQGKQVHDANLVATMLGNGLGRLLTSNRSDFQRFAGLIELVAL